MGQEKTNYGQALRRNRADDQFSYVVLLEHNNAHSFTIVYGCSGAAVNNGRGSNREGFQHWPRGPQTLK